MKRVIIILTAAALAAVLLVSCNKVEETGPFVAKAVLGDVSMLNFPARNPAPKVVDVVSDGIWHVTAPSWITVDPQTGSGETMVTVSVSENADAGGLLEPRKDTLFISGDKKSSRLIIIVSQEGDAYRNADHVTLDKIPSLPAGKAFILDGASVAAVTSAGFVLAEGDVNVYALSTQELAVGDKVSVKGIKGTVNGVPVITQVDECTVKDAGVYDRPEPKNLNEDISAFSENAIEYVQVSGVVGGGNLTLTIDEIAYSVKQVDCPADLSLSKFNGHKVTVTGYSYGLLGANMMGLLTTYVKDDGLDQLIYFEDDFEWMEPWTSAAGAGDDVTVNSVNTDTAPNVFANAEQFAGFIEEFQTRGYGYIWGWKGQDWSDDEPDNGNKRTLYLQRNYLKFGKTSYSSGIILPVLSAIEGTDDIVISFDWCYCMTGGSKPDLTTLTLDVTGGGEFDATSTATSEEIISGQKVGDDGLTSLAWQHVEIRINGATSGTRITIRPTNTDPDVTNSARHQNRWYLDNIKVLPANGGGGGGSSAGMVVLEEDFEWLEPYATGANAPDDVTANSVGSSPNIFTTSALQPILTELLGKGFGYLWGGKGMTEWSFDEPDSGNGRTLYLQKNYLKFGKSDWNSGLILPALSALTGPSKVELTFDWCWCMTGGSKPDIMTLTAEVVGGECFEFSSTQPTAEDQTKLEWQHASVTINGVTPETRIILRPTNVDPYTSNPDRGQNRWYLDNIKIVTK